MGNENTMKKAYDEGYASCNTHGYEYAMAHNPYSDDRHRLAYNRGAFQAYRD